MRSPRPEGNRRPHALENNPNLYTKSYAYDLKDSNFKPSGKEFLFYKYKYLYVRVICDQGV